MINARVSCEFNSVCINTDMIELYFLGLGTNRTINVINNIILYNIICCLSPDKTLVLGVKAIIIIVINLLFSGEQLTTCVTIQQYLQGTHTLSLTHKCDT